MANVLQLDAAANNGIVGRDLVTPVSEVWVAVDVAFSATYLTNLFGQAFAASCVQGQASTFSDEQTINISPPSTGKWTWDFGTPDHFTPAAITALQFYNVEMHLTAGTPMACAFWIDGVSVGTLTITDPLPDIQFLALRGQGGFAGHVYYDNFKAGTTRGATDIYADDFSGDLSGWTDTVNDATIITDPGIEPPSPPAPASQGRVMIAWDDGPLIPFPTWTPIDQGGSTFPYNFVSGYDTHSGRQTLISQTETGTATVYVNDREGLFDDRNGSSPFQGKLSGRQIMLQLYNPVDATWETQFRGLIDDYRYTIDGSAVGADGNPVNCSIEIDCVDMFDYLNGYGLTPGLDGVTPPTGSEDSIYYPANGVSDTVSDRILEILTDANVAPEMSILASGNVKVIATLYNADESALTALRDAADAEMPFIANIYINRSGLFCFRGRYSRFNPDQVAAEPMSDWDFTRWKVGDGKAILADHTRAQMRLLSYSRDRAEIINAAMCYPQGMAATAIPDQVFANSPSIAAYGKHAAAPLTDLITGNYVGPGTISPDDGKTQCFMYAELLVKNKKDPRLCPTELQVKTINPSDFRASATWAILTRSDISHIVNIAAGYAGGTGLIGGATQDDYYIEGRSLVVRPANSAYDYVELNLEVTPFIWSADTNGVFPAFGT